MLNFIKQSFCIPKPTLTEHNLPDQKGHVFIVTGGYSGCGLNLTRILYQKNGIIYVAGRNKEKASTAFARIKQEFPQSSGRLEFLEIDLADLATIKPAVENFLGREERLDVLTNNAGVMRTPCGSKTVQVSSKA
jgi:retinol dehydrogenase-12